MSSSIRILKDFGNSLIQPKDTKKYATPLTEEEKKELIKDPIPSALLRKQSSNRYIELPGGTKKRRNKFKRHCKSLKRKKARRTKKRYN